MFVEVRSRHSKTTETALETLTPRKREKMLALALLYIAEHQLTGVQWRIDVIAVAVTRAIPPIVEHVEDALDW